MYVCVGGGGLVIAAHMHGKAKEQVLHSWECRNIVSAHRYTHPHTAQAMNNCCAADMSLVGMAILPTQHTCDYMYLCTVTVSGSLPTMHQARANC